MRRLLLLALLCVTFLSSLGGRGALASGATPGARLNFEPTVPFVLDGTYYAPADIHRFADQPLHFVLNREAQAEGVLLAFRTQAEASQYMAQSASASAPRRGAAMPLSTGCAWPEHSARIYNWTNFNQDWRDLSGDLPDLRRNQRGWWPWDNWNDVISSIKVGCLTSVTLYVDINYGGGSFAVPQNAILPYLDWIDNRASSIDYRDWEPLCQTQQAQNGQTETWCQVYDDYGTFLRWERVA